MQKTTQAKSVQAAIEVFVIALKVGDAITNGTWQASQLAKHMIFRGTGEDLWAPIHHHVVVQEELELWSRNNVYWAASMVAIALDSATYEIFGDKFADPNPERRAARLLVFLMRSAAAHQPISPTWLCNPPYNIQLSIPSLNIEFDGAAMHGQPVKASHYGGWTKLKLLADYLLCEIQLHEKG